MVMEGFSEPAASFDDSRDNFMEFGIESCRRLDFETEIDLNDFAEDGGNEEKVEDTKASEQVFSVHSRIRKELIPTIGMEFESEDESYKFYNNYAYHAGFGVRKSKSRTVKDGTVRERLFVCSAEGKRGNDKRDVNVKWHRAETRFGCQARMKVNCCLSGKYRVIEFFLEHTHETSTPRKAHLYRSHRRMSLAQIAQADMADSSGIAPKATVEFLSRQAGGRQNLGFIPDDYKNYLRSKRTREMMMGDTGGVLEYLQQMQLNDPNFFYAIQVDEDDLITNIFWADGRMMVDYYFGDVVCFDTTYRKNKEGRPFAMFAGVNNHKQTVIFGAALLYDETISTFTWLFDTFAKAMSGKKPNTILTDQDAAMANALATKWPESCHRLCIWHIYQNAAKQLSSIFEKFKEFAKDFSSCVYDYEDEEDFLNAWKNMLDKYNLQSNDWLSRLFRIRKKWALVYGRETFCADIITTQRSESMNSSLKRYVSYKHDLLRFFQHFQRLVEDRRYEELKADFKASQSSPALSFPVEILKHAASVYTPKVFTLVQNELCKAYDCALNFFGENGTVSKYGLMARGKHFHHTVTYNSIDGSIFCSCKKFEFAGILCAHTLKVLSTKNIQRIPTQYILKRWTKNVKARSAEVICNITSESDPKAEVVRRYRELCRLHTQLATRAAESKKSYDIAILALNNALTEVDTCLKEKTTEDAAQVLSPAINNVPELNERIHIDGYQNSRVSGIKTKERMVAKSKRPKSCLENATRKKKARKKGSHSATHSVMPSALPTQQGSIACTMDMGIEETELHSHFVQQPHSTIDTTFGQTLFHGSSQFSQLLGVDNLSKNFPLDEQDPMPTRMQFIQPFQIAQTQLPDGLNFHGSQVTSQKD